MSATKQISNRSKVLSYLKYFSGYLQPGLLTAKNANAENIDAKRTCIESICIDNINTLEHSRIHLQFFQILKIRDVKIKI